MIFATFTVPAWKWAAANPDDKGCALSRQVPDETQRGTNIALSPLNIQAIEPHEAGAVIRYSNGKSYVVSSGWAEVVNAMEAASRKP